MRPSMWARARRAVRIVAADDSLRFRSLGSRNCRGTDICLNSRTCRPKAIFRERISTKLFGRQAGSTESYTPFRCSPPWTFYGTGRICWRLKDSTRLAVSTTCFVLQSACIGRALGVRALRGMPLRVCRSRKRSWESLQKALALPRGSTILEAG